ncbi:MAG: helix-turn-helix domain-containing protein [Rhodospirillales bacterium]|nr:helix-turn-helix domain-containing protein [Rhodospirillales bacterium]
MEVSGNPDNENLENGLINAHVSEMIKNRREKQGITKIALAQALGISPRQLTKIERGKARLSASHIFKAATYLETTVEALFQGIHDENFQSLPDDIQPTTCQSIPPEEVEQLQRYFLSIPEGKTRNNVLKMIKATAQAKI